jgi:hypothetical protein
MNDEELKKLDFFAKKLKFLETFTKDELRIGLAGILWYVVNENHQAFSAITTIFCSMLYLTKS